MNSLLLSPLVIAQRMPQLLFEAFHPNPFAREESYRAVTEKMEAISEGMIAAQVEAINAPFRVALAFFNGRSMTLAALGTPNKVARAAMEPAERRVRDYVRRLAGVGKLPASRRKAR